MKLIIVGAPGAGKGTMSEELVKKYNFPHISTGDMFRDHLARKTELGLTAKGYMDRGELVPDSLTIQLVKERLTRPDCKDGYLLDGFPRNEAQAEFFMNMLEETNLGLDAVLYLDVDFDKLIKRITGRRICKECKSVYHIEFSPSKEEGICDNCGGELYQRADDTEEALKQRLTAYSAETMPVINFFEKLGYVRHVNANQSIEKVTEDMFKSLEENN
ncbi:MAG: adenylate kinase [Erysipelotrichaceae bacterium]|nr:adenylate kinase [Erysipelotrichaceae bacterium]MBR3693465.1 adenylate kinase [Erysipelotrichales bacterium]